MCVVKINVCTTRRILEKDPLGNTVYPDKSNTTNVLVDNQLLVGDKKIYFQIIVRVSKSACLDNSEADVRAVYCLHNRLASRLASSNTWNFFSPTWQDCTVTEPRLVLYRHLCLGITVKPNASLASDISATIAYQDKVRQIFTAASDRLTVLAFNDTATDFRRTMQEARLLFQTLEDIVACSGDAGGYTAADIRAACQNYEELARCSVDNTASYKIALHNLRKVVWGINFPCCWAARPSVAPTKQS